MQKSGVNRIKAVLAVLLLAFSLYSVFYIAREQNHACSGEGCPVCETICFFELTIQLLSFAAEHFAVAFTFVLFAVLLSVSFKKNQFKASTLISQKIRLNE